MQKIAKMNRYEKVAMERIKELIRDYCDSSQQRFAERTGLNKASVSQYVNGKNVPSSITASKIAKVFGCDPAWIMGFDVDKKPSGKIPSPSPDLDPDDQELLSKYHMLSDEGKGMLQDRADELIALGKTVEEEAKKDARKLG